MSNKNSYINTKTDTYGNFEFRLIAMKSFTGKGKTIKMDSSIKLVYLYMRHRFHYFKLLGKDLFDSYNGISEATGMSKSTVKRCVDDLCLVGFIDKEGIMSSQGTTPNKYIVHDFYKIVDNSAEVIDTTHKQKKPAKTKQIIYGDEPF